MTKTAYMLQSFEGGQHAQYAWYDCIWHICTAVLDIEFPETEESSQNQKPICMKCSSLNEKLLKPV